MPTQAPTRETLNQPIQKRPMPDTGSSGYRAPVFDGRISLRVLPRA